MNTLLKLIFGLKGDFSPGLRPVKKIFQGVEVTPFLGDAGAAVTISADFELEWAFRRVSEENRVLEGVRTRQNMPSLLATLEECRLPITWATVGHLFLQHCERGECGLAHADLPRPPRPYNWVGDWYRLDPCTNWKKHPGWYAPDLIRDIVASRVKHEIGSHSFSHIDFCPEYSTPELVQRELEQCQRLMEASGLRLRSLVFPRNLMGHEHGELLARLGVTSVRHRDPRVRLSYPRRTATGVYWLYDSMNTRNGNWYRYADKARLFIAEAAKRHAAYHLWFHPSDPKCVFEQSFYPILRHIARLRDRGEVWVVTMAELTAFCEAREHARLEVQQHRDGIRIQIDNAYDGRRYGPTDLTIKIPVPKPPRTATITLHPEGRPTGLSFKVSQRDARLNCLVAVPARAGTLELAF